jgi:AcrR family transcriptional regulator
MVYTNWYVAYQPVSTFMSMAPLTREARKEQTREAIVAAARKLFAKTGIEATSLDRIANEIGLTKGAIYSTFSSKDELVEAVAEAFSVSVQGEEIFKPEVPLRDALRSLAEEIMVARKKVTDEIYILFLELFLYQKRHQTWGKRLSEEQRKSRIEEGTRLEEVMKARGARLSLSGTEFFVALQALALGILLMLEDDPNSLSQESVVALFESLAD